MRQLNIKSPSARNYVARQIAKANNRGFASQSKILTVLNILREMKVYNLKQLSVRHREEFLNRLRRSGYSTRTTSTYISYFNRVVEYANKHELRISAKEHGLSRGSFFYVDRAVSKETHEAFKGWLRNKYERTGDIRYEALRHSVELQRAFGLRASESFCIKITEKDPDSGHLHVDRRDDTKNGRERKIPIFKQEQREKLREARNFARAHGWNSLIPPDHTKQQWRGFAYSAVREFRREHPEYRDYHFHGERHAFAQEYFQYLVKQRQEQRKDEAERPLDATTENLDREELREIRREVSEALGHSREEITKAYVA